MAVAKDKGSITKYGGGVLKVRAVSDAGVYTSGATLDLGYITDTELSFDVELEDITDETGAVVASLPGAETVKLTGTFLQTDVDLLDFLRDSTRSTFYQLYYKMTRTGEINAKTQELFAAICKIKPMLKVKAGEKKIPFEITMLSNEAEITIATPNTAFGAIETDSVVIPIGKYYDIVEN